MGVWTEFFVTDLEEALKVRNAGRFIIDHAMFRAVPNFLHSDASAEWTTSEREGSGQF